MRRDAGGRNFVVLEILVQNFYLCIFFLIPDTGFLLPGWFGVMSVMVCIE
jgi:hypothetical protein